MNELEAWYIVKQPDGRCVILPESQLVEDTERSASTPDERWGPYDSQAEAIARRIGLIRAGRCQPL